MISYSKLNQQFKKQKLQYQYFHCQSQSDKYKLAEFIYNNTDNFVMNTFALLWENRKFWKRWQPLVAFDENGKIIGIHAFAEKEINGKKYLKTYYIVTSKECRGKGIAKQLTLQVINDFKEIYSDFFVNSIQNSDGDKFYRKFISDKPTKKVNEFGTIDMLFKNKISKILKNNK